ncbi:MAG: YihY/virulence factor BrkB family protein [Lentisphaeria bacterium]|nr:YihY/virulence factor BrkB family protein [Lentisphaeria bacterium]
MLKKLLSVFRRFGRVLFISVLRYGKDRHSDRAVTLTYYTLFAIVPVAAMLFGIAKGFDLEIRLREVLTQKFSQHEELLQWIYQFADTTLKRASGGIVAGIGVIALLWTVTWLAASIEGSFNAVWELPPRRNILRKVSDYISVMLITPIVLVVMSSAGVLLRNMLGKIAEKMPNPGGCVTFVTNSVVNLTPMAVMIILFTVIYFMAPNTKVKFRSALLAGVITGIVFQLFQDGFIYLQKSIFTYNRIYGSFAALPLFLTWLKLSWQLTLFGAEIGFVDQNIDTGKFDVDPVGRFSTNKRNICRVSLAAVIYRRFRQNRGTTSREMLIERFGITPVEAEFELDSLVCAGVLLRSDEGDASSAYYAPARNAATFTVAECLELLEKSGLSPDNNSMAPAVKTLSELGTARKQSPANCLLGDL